MALTTSTINVAVQVDITDSTPSTAASVGLIGGFFRWVTGRPGYPATTPTGEIDGGATTWHEGFLTGTDRMGKPDRILDLLKGPSILDCKPQ